jgi:hypothetical protein
MSIKILKPEKTQAQEKHAFRNIRDDSPSTYYTQAYFPDSKDCWGAKGESKGGKGGIVGIDQTEPNCQSLLSRLVT